MKHYLVITTNNQRQFPLEIKDTPTTFYADGTKLEITMDNINLLGLMEFLESKSHITIDNTIIFKTEQITSVHHQEHAE